MALGLLKSNADIKCWSNMGETNINWCSGCQVLNLLKTNLIRLKQFLLITLLGHSGCRKWSSLSANRKLIDLRQLNWKLSWQVLFFRPETKSNQVYFVCTKWPYNWHITRHWTNSYLPPGFEYHPLNHLFHRLEVAFRERYL